MIVLIDNYDSFTYNLYQLLGEYEEEIVVVRNDQITIEQLEEMKPKGIVLSPGPGKPEDAGICMEVIRHFYKNVPYIRYLSWSSSNYISIWRRYCKSGAH